MKTSTLTGSGLPLVLVQGVTSLQYQLADPGDGDEVCERDEVDEVGEAEAEGRSGPQVSREELPRRDRR